MQTLETVYADPRRLDPYGPRINNIRVTDEYYKKRRDQLLAEINGYTMQGGKIPDEYKKLIDNVFENKYNLSAQGIGIDGDKVHFVGYVNTEAAPIRSEANINGHIVTYARKGSQVTVTGQVGAFYKLGSSGKSFISTSHVTKQKDIAVEAKTETAIKAYISREMAPIRIAPSYDASIINYGRKGASITIKGEEGSFFKIGENRYIAMEDVGKNEDIGKHLDEIGEVADENVIAELSNQSFDLSSAEGIKEYAGTLGILGKIGLIGKILSAKFNSIMNGTDFWSEMGSIGQSTGPAFQGSYTGRDGVVTSLSGTDRDRYLAMAKSQIGYKEKTNSSNLIDFEANAGGNDYTKYVAEMLGTNGLAWCAAFAAWNAKAAGIPSDIVWQSGNFASCTSVMKHAKENGTWRYRGEYTPEPGDQILFNWNGVSNPRSCNVCDHIGIVEYTANGKVYTIEGNSKNQVRRKEYILHGQAHKRLLTRLSYLNLDMVIQISREDGPISQNPILGD